MTDRRGYCLISLALRPGERQCVWFGYVWSDRRSDDFTCRGWTGVRGHLGITPSSFTLSLGRMTSCPSRAVARTSPRGFFDSLRRPLFVFALHALEGFLVFFAGIESVESWGEPDVVKPFGHSPLPLFGPRRLR